MRERGREIAREGEGESETEKVWGGSRKVDIRLPGEGNSNSHDARLVHKIISMIK